MRQRGDGPSLGLSLPLQLGQIHHARYLFHGDFLLRIEGGIVGHLQLGGQLLLDPFPELRACGLITGGSFGNHALHGGLKQQIRLELILQRAAVPRHGGVLENGPACFVKEAVRAALGVELIARLAQLFRVYGNVQTLFAAADGFNRGAGRDQLLIDQVLLVHILALEGAGFDFLLEDLGPLQGGWHVRLRHVRRDPVHILDVVLEGVLQGAAVTGRGGLFGGVRVFLDKLPEGGAFHQLVGVRLCFLCRYGSIQTVGVPAHGVHGTARPEQLREQRHLRIQRCVFEVVSLDLILKPLNPGGSRGHIRLRHVRRQADHGLDVVLEALLQLAAVAFSRKLPGLLGIPVQESAEGAAFGQLLGAAVDLLGVDPLFQAFLLPPDRADAGAGGQHLGVQRRIFIGLRNERVHRLELVFQRLVPFQRGGKHLLRDVLRDAFHFFDVVPEGFAQGAAVACRRSRSGAAVGIVHEFPEGRAVFPGVHRLPELCLLQPYLERVRFASLGVDGLP